MNRKEPLFRVVKRESSSPVRQALAYVAAVVIALLIGAALLSSMDVDPLTFYQKMVTMGIPGNKFPWRIVENFVKLFVPLLITSLALSLAFRMRFWNIGGEGQFIMGAICAAAAAHKLGPVLPQPLVVLVMAWVMVFATGAQAGLGQITQRSLVFLVLSGLATGASWLCYYRAIQLGSVSKVVPIDKMSVVITLILAFVFLHEEFSLKMLIGSVLITAGTLVMVL